MDWAGLDWPGLDWLRWDCVRLVWNALWSIGLHLIVFGMIGLDCIRLGCIALRLLNQKSTKTGIGMEE